METTTSVLEKKRDYSDDVGAQKPTSEQEETVSPCTPTPDENRFSTVPLTAKSTNWFRKLDLPDNRISKHISTAHRRSTSQSSTVAIRTNSPGPTTSSAFDEETDGASSPPLGKLSVFPENSFTSSELRSPLQKRFSELQLQSQKDPDDLEDIDWDFWGTVVSDYTGFARDRPDDLARAIERGIPHALRGMMWQLMSASKDPGLESVYADLLKEKSTHEKAILRDLGRTFPHHEYFMDGSGVGQENLFNVLKAYSLCVFTGLLFSALNLAVLTLRSDTARACHS